MENEKSELTDQAIILLEYLVGKLDVVDPADPRTFVGYKQAHEEMGLERKGPIWGNSLRTQGLEELAEWTLRQNLPAITGLVVSLSDYEPGEGYYRAHERESGDRVWWIAQIEKARSFDWLARLRSNLQPSPSASDLEYPKRAWVKTQRIIRDSLLASRVKNLHNYCCQLCGETILLADGQRYAEAHHLKPVGQPHNGPDVMSNLICVCPNDHARLDYGAILIDLTRVRLVSRHTIAEEFIRYHNEVIVSKLG